MNTLMDVGLPGRAFRFESRDRAARYICASYLSMYPTASTRAQFLFVFRAASGSSTKLSFRRIHIGLKKILQRAGLINGERCSRAVSSRAPDCSQLSPIPTILTVLRWCGFFQAKLRMQVCAINFHPSHESPLRLGKTLWLRRRCVCEDMLAMR